LTEAAERIVANGNAASEDWENAWDDALKTLEGKLNSTDSEEAKTYDEFIVFVSKVAVRQGWNPSAREKITQNLEKLGGGGLTFKIDSIYDIGRYYGSKEGEQKRLRNMLEQCISLRFPRITQTAMNGILSIDDSNVLESIFRIACSSDSLDNFQRDIRGIAPVF